LVLGEADAPAQAARVAFGPGRALTRALKLQHRQAPDLHDLPGISARRTIDPGTLQVLGCQVVDACAFSAFTSLFRRVTMPRAFS